LDINFNLSTFYQNKQRSKIEAQIKISVARKKKDNDLIKLEEEYELIHDTYEVLKLELDITLTKEMQQKHSMRTTKIIHFKCQKYAQDRNLVILTKDRSNFKK
jgi:hypothetical protein